MRRLPAPLVCVAMLATAVSDAAAQNFDFSDPNVRALRTAIFSGVAHEVGTLPNPLGGGFTLQFDETLQTFVRTTDTFGPLFADRADTTGPGTLTLTASYSRHTFDDVDGLDLRNRGIVATVTGGVRKNRLEFRDSVDADVFTVGALYGLTSKLDLGVIIPILRVSVKERVRRISLQDCSADLRVCGDLQARNDPLRPTDAESTGLGDIVLRSKYNLYRAPDVAGGKVSVAASLDVKLPSGDEGDRATFTSGRLRFVSNASNRVEDTFVPLGDPPLGLGIVRVKPQIIASGSWSGVAPHLNVGFELGETLGITNDFICEVGVDWRASRRVTLIADLLGRYALNVKRPRVTREFSGRGRTADAETLTASLGVKFNPFSTFLVFLNVLIPINDTGLRDDFAPTIGLEWSH